MTELQFFLQQSLFYYSQCYWSFIIIYSNHENFRPSIYLCETNTYGALSIILHLYLFTMLCISQYQETENEQEYTGHNTLRTKQ